MAQLCRLSGLVSLTVIKEGLQQDKGNPWVCMLDDAQGFQGSVRLACGSID